MGLPRLPRRQWTSAFLAGDSLSRRALSTHAPITESPRHASTLQGASRSKGSAGLNDFQSQLPRHTTSDLNLRPSFNTTRSRFASSLAHGNTHNATNNNMADKLQSVVLRDRLAAAYPWTTTPLIVGAPMRVMSGPELAVAVSAAGGIGFIGPGEKPESTAADLETARNLLASSPTLHPYLPQTTTTTTPSSPDTNTLPIGVGYQIWTSSLPHATQHLSTHHPTAAWLFAPRNGQSDITLWTSTLRSASPQTQIWLQIGTVREALDAVYSPSPPDVLVIQGAEAGGHGRAVDGTGFITLLPEIADAISGSGIPLIAAGGVADGRGVVAALGVGAAGVAMGTRFLASHEARIKKGYRDEVVRATDGGVNTVRTQLYNHLRGTFGWPEQWSPRTIVNRSWEEHKAGTGFDEIKKRHDEAVAKGDAAWGPEGWTATYAGANVGLIRSVAGAAEIVEGVRDEAANIIRALSSL